MSPINLAIVGLRLLAIYCFVEAVPLLSEFGLVSTVFVPGAMKHPSSAAIVVGLLPGILLLLFAVILFVFSAPLGWRIASSLLGESKEGICTFEQLQALAFAVAGILILTISLPSVGRALQDLSDWYSIYKEGGRELADPYFKGWLYDVGVFAQVAVGLLLFLNPKGVRKVWQWLRKAGT